METAADQLPCMPEPYRLEKVSSDGETVIFRGPYVIGRYEDDDIGLRNLVIVSLREAGHSGKDVAACFGLSVPYVSALRGRVKRSGSLGLVREVGRPRKLSEAKVRRAEEWSAEGMTNKEIARRLAVHPSTIGRLIGKGASHDEPVAAELDLEGDQEETVVTSISEDTTTVRSPGPSRTSSSTTPSAPPSSPALGATGSAGGPSTPSVSGWPRRCSGAWTCWTGWWRSPSTR